jgi:hypothetical protein
MALKIVHLCDVHSSKNVDIPASFAHTIILDGGTYAVDLCAECDAERFMPLAAFLEAYGLLTDGNVDPREAVSENLRTMYAEQLAAPAPAVVRRRARSESDEKETTAPVVAPDASKTSQNGSRASLDVPVDERTTSVVRERRELALAMLNDAAEGLSASELAQRLDTTATALNASVLPALRDAGLAEFIGARWWAPQNVSPEMREKLARAREIVAVRDSVPRVCPVDGETLTGNRLWEDHCVNVHKMRPAEIFGLTCPLDGETFVNPQTLGMHGRREHDAVHTPALFQLAKDADDPVGVIAAMRERVAGASA